MVARIETNERVLRLASGIVLIVSWLVATGCGGDDTGDSESTRDGASGGGQGGASGSSGAGGHPPEAGSSGSGAGGEPGLDGSAAGSAGMASDASAVGSTDAGPTDVSLTPDRGVPDGPRDADAGTAADSGAEDVDAADSAESATLDSSDVAQSDVAQENGAVGDDASDATREPEDAAAPETGEAAAPEAGDAAYDVASKPTHNLGGVVAGLQLGSLVILNRGGQAQMVDFDGAQSFTFPPVAEGDSYDVTVGAQPSGQYCVVAGASGVMGSSDVALSVNCRALSVVIDEIHMQPSDWAYGDANGDGVSDGLEDEFIEILNLESFPVDVSGWVLMYGGAVARHTFSANVLAPGQRAVVFGGGSPSGGFGGAIVRTGLSTALANTNLTVTLLSQSLGGLALDSLTYSRSSTCSNNCASMTRSPPGTGTLVNHNALAGAGILWSPGTEPRGAIPKLSPAFSIPKGGSSKASVSGLVAQFNMFMSASDLTSGNLHLFASSCNGPQNEQLLSIVAGFDASSVSLSPTPPTLAYASTYCVVADSGLHSGTTLASPATLGTSQSFEFTTRAAVSAPASTVVISEVGGCRVPSTGSNPCGGSANDEFVELFNPTSSSVDITGWSVQRRSAGGSTSCWISLSNASPIVVAPHGYYLMGGPNYVAVHYPGSPQPDYPTPGNGSITGVDESIVLIAGASCTSSAPVVDSLSLGSVTERPMFLQLPAIVATIVSQQSLERKACYNSTADAGSTGMLSAGGHETKGNAERIGGSNADFIVRSSPNPQNSLSATESGTCP